MIFICCDSYRMGCTQMLLAQRMPTLSTRHLLASRSLPIAVVLNICLKFKIHGGNIKQKYSCPYQFLSRIDNYLIWLHLCWLEKSRVKLFICRAEVGFVPGLVALSHQGPSTSYVAMCGSPPWALVAPPYIDSVNMYMFMNTPHINLV